MNLDESRRNLNVKQAQFQKKLKQVAQKNNR
jgi:hypothetical protein